MSSQDWSSTQNLPLHTQERPTDGRDKKLLSVHNKPTFTFFGNNNTSTERGREKTSRESRSKMASIISECILFLGLALVYSRPDMYPITAQSQKIC